MHRLETKGMRLSERVFIPEAFAPERAAELTIRHHQALAPLLSLDAPRHFKMMVAVGELKEFKATTMGYKLVFKHFPDGVFCSNKGQASESRRSSRPSS